MVQKLYKNWLQVSKIISGIWITSDKQWKVQKVEIQEELPIMAMKNDAKSEEKLTCHFEVDMRIMTYFDPTA